jgi:glycosyltransferase involved in cell wall biosynthesis
VEKAVNNDLPMVSVIIPIRNEEEHISRCLESVLRQDYPKGLMEVLVIDGMSNDRSRQILDEMGVQYPQRFKVLDNPQMLTSCGLNRGIKAATGDIIVRVDGHTVIAEDYISQSLACLETTQAQCVGGPMVAKGRGLMGQAIALAICSSFGMGDAIQHYSDKECCTETVYLGVFPRNVFDELGLYREDFACNEDDEHIYRLRKNGGRIFFTPKIRSVYYNRTSIVALFRQYYRYGLWKVRVAQTHPRMMLWRHFVPPAFAFCLILPVLLAIPWPLLGVISPLFLVLYTLVAMVFAVSLSVNLGWKYCIPITGAFFTLHFAYGVGFLVGLIRFSHYFSSAVKENGR